MSTISDPPEQAALSTNGAAQSAAVEAREITVPAELATAVSLPSDFRFDEVRAVAAAAPSPSPALGPLAAFRGDWHGNGFNTIFRPDNPETPTKLPVPVSGSDNILELNLTHETLSFSPSLGSVPNRGSVQADAFLNGVPYLQSISDVTTGRPIGIHLEPGLWVIVPPSKDPAEGSTLVRMGSIPHGTTINAQGKFRKFSGPPVIGHVDITPFSEGAPSNRIRFASQTASNHGTPRIPQDLTSFISDGTIVQAMLDDPNELLRHHITGLHITETETITISTGPSLPLFGGGTDNIAFLWGDAGAVHSPHPTGQNSQAVKMTAIFWIETVQHTLTVPPHRLGQAPLLLKPKPTVPGQPVPTFNVRPPIPITAPREIKVFSTQIQYTQTVQLNFATLTWPHVSVATLVPASPLPVPPSVWQ
ncbi:MAG TPA: heme-binding protein [Solirubrobacteraceae bacterium]|nr:heme-binding protein [Solirubrobacteraceae bacterium]